MPAEGRTATLGGGGGAPGAFCPRSHRLQRRVHIAGIAAATVVVVAAAWVEAWIYAENASYFQTHPQVAAAVLGFIALGLGLQYPMVWLQTLPSPMQVRLGADGVQVTRRRTFWERTTFYPWSMLRSRPLELGSPERRRLTLFSWRPPRFLEIEVEPEVIAQLPVGTLPAGRATGAG